MQDISKNLKFFPRVDEVFNKPDYPKPFRFDAEVAEVFDDMAKRSIPMYAEVTRYAALWIERYYQPGTAIYDLGCSTGTTLELLGQVVSSPAKFVGVDNSRAMISKAERKLSTFPPNHRLSLRCEDVLATPLHDASGVIINYTLQFLPLAKRLELLRKIYGGLKPGGLLFLSEKIVSRHPQIQETTTDLYYGFKSRNRYSEREIARKKESLENILIPLSEDRLSTLLSEAGFICHESVMKWNNFVSIAAIKEALP